MYKHAFRLSHYVNNLLQYFKQSRMHDSPLCAAPEGATPMTAGGPAISVEGLVLVPTQSKSPVVAVISIALDG